ncbi:Transcriptional regulator, PucR family [Nostocoides japonicum T1-X7]|uniref:Transcriptional regulator, PucR family n=2 Tax=Nostocoides japonicum TaxID=99481 RepID=A0A077M4U0_9MICO|nr:Transcriptional regulator, PucR family [Tetrasphaera japonica T1-X7]
MLPTIRDALAMPSLARAELELCAGEDQLDRPVRWLHAAEVADIADLLRGDEIVLTTGVFLSEDPQAAREYIESLAAVGVAGLILELGRRWTEAPASLVQAATDFDVLFAVLHREVSFSDVVEEVGARIVDAEVDDLRASERIHNTFTRLDIEGATPDEILGAVVRLDGLPVVLESNRHQVIALDPGTQTAAAVLTDWARRSIRVTVSGRTGYDRRSGWLTTIVGSRGDDWGRLVLLTDALPRRRDYVLVERAAAALTLNQMRARAHDSIERSAHTALLSDLRAGRHSADLLARLESADFPLKQRNFVAVAICPETPSGRRHVSGTDLPTTLRRTTRTLGYPALIGSETDHVMALLSVPEGQNIKSLMTQLSREIRRSRAVAIACGSIVKQISAAHETLVDAQSVVASGSIGSYPDRAWISIEDSHLPALLYLLRHDQRVQSFVLRELSPLINHDEKGGPSLLSLLAIYLDTAGGKTAAARRLLLSRPVLYERIAKIESILKVDLDDPQIRTALHVAVMAQRVMGDILAETLLESDRA